MNTVLIFTRRRIIFLVIIGCQLSHLCAQSTSVANKPHRSQALQTGADLPRPAADLSAGTWKYKTTVVQGDGTYFLTNSTTIKEGSGAWTVTVQWETPDGSVSDVSTLEKGTLILRKESFKHFAKPGRPWAIATNVDFTDNEVTGSTNMSGQETPVALAIRGPLFVDDAGAEATIGCLPLAVGYSTTFRNFDVQKIKERLAQLKVVGMERVSVPAGTFNSFKVELISGDSGSNTQTVWIAKDSRTPVKSLAILGNIGANVITELVP